MFELMLLSYFFDTKKDILHFIKFNGSGENRADKEEKKEVSASFLSQLSFNHLFWYCLQCRPCL